MTIELPESGDIGDLSDGYHTFNELYEYRLLYNAALFNAWEQERPQRVPVVKSRRHSDGELVFGGGWFVVVAQLPTGQISNHYPAKQWSLFKIPAVYRPPAYDGHSPSMAANRLRAFITMPEENL